MSTAVLHRSDSLGQSLADTTSLTDMKGLAPDGLRWDFVRWDHFIWPETSGGSTQVADVAAVCQPACECGQAVGVGDPPGQDPPAGQRIRHRTQGRRLRSGRGVGPSSWRRIGVRPPRVRRLQRSKPRGCRVDGADARAIPSGTQWRLTNRGIAVILLSGAVVAAAAVTVITATALTVTSSGYHPPQTSVVSR